MVFGRRDSHGRKTPVSRTGKTGGFGGVKPYNKNKCFPKQASSFAHTVHHMVVENFRKLLSGQSQTLVTIPTSDSVPYAVEAGKEFGGRQHLPVNCLLTQTIPDSASSPDDRSVLEELRHGQGSMAGPSFPTSLAPNLPNRELQVRQINRNRKIINFREKN